MKFKKGMTLLELIVMVIVLAGLILILYIGARAWQRVQNSDVDLCRENRTQYEKALLKYRACKDLGQDSIIDPEKVLIHDGLDPSEFKCPKGGVYIFSKSIPPVGVPSITCDILEHQKKTKVTEH